MPLADETVGDELRRFSGRLEGVVEEWGRPDLVHDHGLWRLCHRRVAAFCRREGIPRVVSPRGMAEEWALNHKKWKKRVGWWLYQRRDLRSAVALHATAESEAAQLRELGLVQPIMIEPNGVRLPMELIGRPRSHVRRADEPRTALFLSRIHRKKGLPLLLEAWARLAPAGWRVRIVGPDEDGHTAELRQLCEKLKLAHGTRVGTGGHGVLGDEGGAGPAIEFCGPLEGDAKWAAFREADLFVLPTYSENFGIAVAEALACRLPVITTTGAPWSGLRDRGCGWWIKPKVEPLMEALATAIALTDEERAAMGERGAAWVEAEFTWGPIAARMQKAYEEILGRVGERRQSPAAPR
jgi:glycosyltransferase involved in cell wall biosynthesis